MAKVMIVDDSGTLRRQLRSSLELANYNVIEAQDGTHALELLTKEKDIDLILCDINMPRMDGMTLCKKIKALPELRAIPIFMLTTEASPEMKAKGKEIGVLGWITKPFQTDYLVEAINKILSK